MSDFKKFKKAVQDKFKEMTTENNLLFITDVEKDLIWETYLSSFPKGTNNKFRERNEYDCNTCRQFLRPYGNLVSIKDNELVSIWDIEVEGYYQEVANSLSKLVKSTAIRDKFITKISDLGTDCNHEQTDNGIRTWEHFYLKIPQKFVNISKLSEESIAAKYRDSKNVYKRSLEEITTEAIEVVLELIDSNSIYRGEEHKNTVKSFLAEKKKYEEIPDDLKDNYCWVASETSKATKIRNSSIGTLLVDISNGRELDESVSAFERIMAPTNYKRPKAIFTNKMIEEAHSKIVELGFENSLGRRYAIIEDITVNNVLFANREAKKSMSGNIFDELKEEVKTKPKNFEKAEEIGIEDFINNVLPTANKIELLLENKHSNSLMSLIAPEDKDSKTMFKWGNNFSWAYNGDVTDSIREAVKEYGGKVDGVLRFSIAWDNNDDLDAHCIEPNNNRIYFRNKYSSTGGNLDVDIINPSDYRKTKKGIVENITWPSLSTMLEGRYKLIVHNYNKRPSYGFSEGFKAEIEYDGQVYEFEYKQALRSGQEVLVAEFEFSKKNGIKFLKNLESKTSGKTIWGLETNKFHNVSLLLNSPNHWDDKVVGNKHSFFILEGCVNDGQPRGFFNEFLNEELMQQKRVFEALGSKMKVKPSDRQLSGVGISSTNKSEIILRVTGKVTRILKVKM